MQPIAEWLAKIDLERYAAAFAENDIDVAVLPHLTDADLEKIGVSLGHRRKMLAAIAELGGAVPASPHPALAVQSDPSREWRKQYARCCVRIFSLQPTFPFALWRYAERRPRTCPCGRHAGTVPSLRTALR
jgi:hypothetical protein